MTFSDQNDWSRNVARSGIAADVAIIAVSAFLLLWGLGDRGLWHSEGRWAQIPREMTLTGDYFHPTIGGEPYFDKPVMTYWMVAIAARFFGGYSEMTARLPSAISGLIAVGCTLWLGRRLWSATVARIAAAILMTSYGFLFWSRTADADAENLAAIMLAICWYWARRDRAGFGSFLVFYLIVFIGALMKGLPAVIVPVLAVLVDVFMNDRWRRVMTPAHFLAALIGGLVYVAPFVYASMTRVNSYAASGFGLVFQENFKRFFRAFDHKGPVYLYFYALPVLLLPWAPLFVGAVVGLLVSRQRLDMHTRWLGWATAVIFAFFTACDSRRGYYVLPLLPLSALLVGVFLIHARNTFTRDERLHMILRHTMIVQLAVVSAAVGLELAGTLIGPKVAARYGVIMSRQLYVSMIVVGVVAAVAGLAALSLERNRATVRRGFWPAAAVATILMGGFFGWQQDMLDDYRSEPAFARTLKAQLGGLEPEDVGLYRCSAANLLFYLGMERPVAVLHNDNKLQMFLSTPGKRIVITQRQYTEDAAKAAPVELAGRQPDLIEAAGSISPRPSDEDLVAWIIEPRNNRSASAEGKIN